MLKSAADFAIQREIQRDVLVAIRSRRIHIVSQMAILRRIDFSRDVSVLVTYLTLVSKSVTRPESRPKDRQFCQKRTKYRHRTRDCDIMAYYRHNDRAVSVWPVGLIDPFMVAVCLQSYQHAEG